MKYLDLLGHQVKDRITGFRGVVEIVAYDLYGCIQVGVKPPIDDKGKLDDSRWLDAKRVQQESALPVMEVPSFEETVEEDGPAERPRR